MATPHITAWHPVARLYPLASLRTRLRRLGIVTLVVCNLAAAGTAVFGAKAVLMNPGAKMPASNTSVAVAAENAEVASEFYAAVNEAIRTGDAAPLDALVAPGIDWCLPCPAQAQTPDLEGLKRYATDLHRESPEMRLVVDDVVGGLLETAIVRVHVSGYPVAGEPSPWGPVDTLRFAHGQIVERRNGPDGATLAEPLLGTDFDALPPAATGVVLARLNFAVDSRLEGLLSAGPTMLIVESGALWVGIAHEGRILRAGGQVETVASDTGTDQGAGIEAIIGPGDGAVVPGGVRFSLSQDGLEPAVVLGIMLVFQDNRSDGPRPQYPERGAFDSVDSDFGAPGWLAPTVRILHSGRVDAWAPGPVRVAIGRAILAPGARVFPPNSETLFVAVESGTLHLAGSEARTVVGGMGAIEPPGPDRSLRNAGAGLLALVVVTFAPVVE